MTIAGFQKQSLIDYPENISSVVFTQGCNFRCPYCHNPELVVPERYTSSYNEADILDYIYKYKHLLTAVCITGGEPCLHQDLPDFISKIKAIGIKVKLDSNGSHPSMLKELMNQNLVDFIAMDIKHLLNIQDYRRATARHLSQATFANIQESIAIIQESGIAHEFRTTVAKGLHTLDDIQQLKALFGDNYKVQNYRNENALDQQSKLMAFTEDELARV